MPFCGMQKDFSMPCAQLWEPLKVSAANFEL
jgi:hypothetical protein